MMAVYPPAGGISFPVFRCKIIGIIRRARALLIYFRKKEQNEMDKKKAAATALATTIAASGAAVDATFDSPQDILQNTYVEPVVDYVTPDGTIDDDGTTQDDEDKGEQAVTAAKKTLREWVLELPLAVRAIVVVPLWFVGNLVMYAGHLVIVGLSPVWGSILNLLMLAGVLTAAFTIAAKAMFPDVPLRKILNKRTFKGILIAAVFVFLLDLALKVGWPPYMQYRTIAIALFTLAVLFLLVMRFGRRENKRRRKEREMAEAMGVDEEDLVYESLGQTFTLRRPKGDS